MQSRPAAAGRRVFRALVVTLAAFGFVIGVQAAVIHLQVDPLADVRAYYDAGARSSRSGCWGCRSAGAWQSARRRCRSPC
jgi:hypothetical protein